MTVNQSRVEKNTARFIATPVADIYPHYVTKVTKKGRTVDELNTVICWLTGYDEAALARQLDERTTFADFFAGAQIDPGAELISGSICGEKIQEIADPLWRNIRCLDKLVDELARGRPMGKILRRTGTSESNG